MKKVITIAILALTINAFAQKTPTYKEEKIQDKHNDRTATYMITFKDGIKDKICQKTDGKWWVLIMLTKDDGPYDSKEAAISRAYSRTKGASDAGQKVGAAAAGTVVKKTSYVKDGYMKDGKRMYTK